MCRRCASNRSKPVGARRASRCSGGNMPATLRTRHRFRAVHKLKAISFGPTDGIIQRSASQFLHSAIASGAVRVPVASFMRMIPSDVEQKLLAPVRLASTGVAVTT